MSKIKNLFNKHGNLALAIINTIFFTQNFFILLTAAATPLTAFMAVLTGLGAFIGWGEFFYEREMAKYQLAKVLDITKKSNNG